MDYRAGERDRKREILTLTLRVPVKLIIFMTHAHAIGYACCSRSRCAAHTWYKLVLIMATSATHAQASEARNVSVSGTYLMLKDACSRILEDAGFKNDTEGSVICLKMAHDFLCLLDNPNQETTKLVSWLCTDLRQVINEACKPGCKPDKEKVWTKFHKVRSTNTFCQKWHKFLEHNKMPKEPIFYQHLTMEVFEALLKASTPLKTKCPVESIAPMTYEEENALRYIGGYMTTTLSHKFKREKKKYELEALKELSGDETEVAEESEEWTASVDRGGLAYINNTAHQFLCAVEYSMRRHMHTDNMREMNDTFRQELSTEIKEDDDVQFHWIMLSSSMEEEVSHNVLDSIIYLYITVRGFSFASSVLERYKREAKKGTQKAKTLRQSTK